MNRLSDTKKAAKLFGDSKSPMILSCLQKLMGAVYADEPENPQSAVAAIGDFLFFAGRPDAGMLQDIERIYEKKQAIMVPQGEGWNCLIEERYGQRCTKILRYAMKCSPEDFNRYKLRQSAGGLPKDMRLVPVDKTIFSRCLDTKWSEDLVSNYKNFEEYKKLGIGFVILKGEEIVSGASSYASCKGKIEIQIDTKNDYRRQGLAYICGAKLISECLKKSLFPNWDAHNEASARLAEKLGYVLDRSYAAYVTELSCP